MALILLAVARPCGTEWLTRKAASKNVDRRDARPVDGGDVTEVRDVGIVVREDPRGGGILLDVPCDFGVEVGGNRHVEAAVPREQ